jgi:hypothetical protein
MGSIIIYVLVYSEHSNQLCSCKCYNVIQGEDWCMKVVHTCTLPLTCT